MTAADYWARSTIGLGCDRAVPGDQTGAGRKKRSRGWGHSPFGSALSIGADSWGERRRGRAVVGWSRTFRISTRCPVSTSVAASHLERLPVHPAHVHVVNLEQPPAEVPDWIEVDHGDACALPRRSPRAGTTWCSPTRSSSTWAVTSAGCGSPSRCTRSRRRTGCRRRTGISRSSRTGSRRACSSCRYGRARVGPAVAAGARAVRPTGGGARRRAVDRAGRPHPDAVLLPGLGAASASGSPGCTKSLIAIRSA